MSDSIDRQAAIDAVNRLSLGETDATRLAMRIWDYLERLPSAQPTFDARDTQYNLPIGTDLISRQAAIDALKGCYCGGEDSCGEPWIYEDHAIKAIEQLPSAQPIIRCKDCAWWTKQEDSLQGRCALLQIYPTGEWFCGNAGRREETA